MKDESRCMMWRRGRGDDIPRPPPQGGGGRRLAAAPLSPQEEEELRVQLLGQSSFELAKRHRPDVSKVELSEKVQGVPLWHCPGKE